MEEGTEAKANKAMLNAAIERIGQREYDGSRRRQPRVNLTRMNTLSIKRGQTVTLHHCVAPPSEMFGLLYGFYEYLTRKDEHKVVVLGLDSAGKSVCLSIKNHH